MTRQPNEIRNPKEPLAAALRAARFLGITPVPLRPRSKVPVLPDWQHSTYADDGEVDAAFSKAQEILRQRVAEGTWDDGRLNLGVALGKDHGGLIDIDLDHNHALRIAPDILPHTPMRSGHPERPASHFWYRVDGFDPGVRRFRLPNGHTIIEFRGGGGQTVVPPSTHPNGDHYTWYGDDWGGEDGPTRLDAGDGETLLALVATIALAVTLADNWPTRGGRHDAYLALAGGLLRDEGPDGRPRIHPLWEQNLPGLIRMLVVLTNDHDGATSRISEAMDTTRRRILRGKKARGWPSLERALGPDHITLVRGLTREIESLTGTSRQSRSKGLESAAQLSSTHSASEAASGDEAGETAQERAVRLALLPDEQRDPLDERMNEWERVDNGPYLRQQWKPQTPGLLYREDGAGMLYPGRLNLLYGEGGSGKTLIALDMARRIMADQGRVMMIDLEDEPVNTIERLHLLGVPDNVIGSDQFIYLHPERHPLASMQVDRYGTPIPTPRGEASEEALREVLSRYNPDLVIVDGTTSLFRIHGLDSNSVAGVDVVATWLKDLTSNNTRTVVMIDHISKGASPTSGPIGSQHKIAMVQGAALLVTSIVKPRPGEVGELMISIGKDRNAGVIQHANHADPPVIAEVEIHSDPEDGLRIKYLQPHPGSNSSLRVIVSPDPDKPGEDVVKHKTPGGKTKMVSDNPAASNDSKRGGGRPPAIGPDELKKLLKTLQQHDGWWPRAKWFANAGMGGLGDETQRTAIKALLDAGKVRKTGSTRNTQYQAVIRQVKH